MWLHGSPLKFSGTCCRYDEQIRNSTWLQQVPGGFSINIPFRHMYTFFTWLFRTTRRRAGRTTQEASQWPLPWWVRTRPWGKCEKKSERNTFDDPRSTRPWSESAMRGIRSPGLRNRVNNSTECAESKRRIWSHIWTLRRNKQTKKKRERESFVSTRQLFQKLLLTGGGYRDESSESRVLLYYLDFVGVTQLVPVASHSFHQISYLLSNNNAIVCLPIFLVKAHLHEKASALTFFTLKQSTLYFSVYASHGMLYAKTCKKTSTSYSVVMKVVNWKRYFPLSSRLRSQLFFRLE